MYICAVYLVRAFYSIKSVLSLPVVCRFAHFIYPSHYYAEERYAFLHFTFWFFLSILMDFAPLAVRCSNDVASFSASQLTTASRTNFWHADKSALWVCAPVENKTTNRKHLFHLTIFTTDGAQRTFKHVRHWMQEKRDIPMCTGKKRLKWLDNVNRQHSTVSHTHCIMLSFSLFLHKKISFNVDDDSVRAKRRGKTGFIVSTWTCVCERAFAARTVPYPLGASQI